LPCSSVPYRKGLACTSAPPAVRIRQARGDEVDHPCAARPGQCSSSGISRAVWHRRRFSRRAEEARWLRPCGVSAAPGTTGSQVDGAGERAAEASPVLPEKEREENAA
jgi:hypothetical protein